MKQDVGLEIAVCDGRGENHDIPNYFSVWLPVIGYDCKNIIGMESVAYFFLWAFLRFFSCIKLCQIIQFSWHLNVSLTPSFGPSWFSHFQCSELITSENFIVQHTQKANVKFITNSVVLHC